MSGKAGKLARERLQPLTAEELAEVTGGYNGPGWNQFQPCGFNQWQFQHHRHHHHHHHHHHHFHPNFLGCGPQGFGGPGGPIL